ncbi:hypothetical protein [Methylomonas rosea]|uniref:Lipoprotein n=1 Tax=Methylomonas rosea TaxID=2952227 RepID=A0ABT1TXS5_9GAMM|nr:hypothetical protein [Methylomonas sp. WSC-7]MCQ8119559.1 hypothetical protein [Methylomonas sp. WSC-7]
MLHRCKLLTIPTAIAALMGMSGCVVNPANSQGSSYNHNGHNAAQELKTILVYDLKNKNVYQAESELRDRGYSEYGREGSHSWWFNEQKKECYEFEEENNKVHKIHLKSTKDCENAPGNHYSRHHDHGDTYNNNYDNNQRYNNGNNSHFGQTPSSLSDMVGARAGQAEGELSRRGYQFARASTSGYGQTDFWRENHSGSCVSIVTNDGRYQSIVYTAADACN